MGVIIGKRESKQQRPRSRTLTQVHEEVLQDIVSIIKPIINAVINLLYVVITGVPRHHHWQIHQSDPRWQEAHQNQLGPPRQGEG